MRFLFLPRQKPINMSVGLNFGGLPVQFDWFSLVYNHITLIDVNFKSFNVTYNPKYLFTSLDLCILIISLTVRRIQMFYSFYNYLFNRHIWKNYSILFTLIQTLLYITNGLLRHRLLVSLLFVYISMLHKFEPSPFNLAVNEDKKREREKVRGKSKYQKQNYM